MKLFDPYLTGLGIDVSDHHLRMAQVDFFGSVRRLEEVVLPEGLVVDEQVEKPGELKKILKEKLVKLGFTNRPYRTTVLVPESRVFSHSLLLQFHLKGEERNARARDIAQREIPVPFSQAKVCSAYGAKEGDQIRATVYAVEKVVFDPLKNVFQDDVLRLVALEANTKSLLRVFLTYGQAALEKVSSGSLIAMVDVGHAWTTLSLYFRDGTSLFSRTIPHVSKENASLKKTELPQSVVDTIVETIRETMLFFEQDHLPIGCIVLGGVEAQDDRFTEQLKSLGDSISTHLISDTMRFQGVSKNQLHAFGAAIGAALRSARPGRHANQHNFLET